MRLYKIGLGMLVALILSISLSVNIQTNAESKRILPQVSINMIDVGQADSILIQDDGKSMLIDTGNGADESTIDAYLKSMKIAKLDYLILTHPHEDHIGSASFVLDNYPVKNVIMPEVTSNTKVFEGLLDTLISKKSNVIKAVSGKAYILGKSKFQILAPNGKEYSDLNNYSVVIKLTYDKTSFLFMGDAEKLSENEIIGAGYDLKADFIKIGHHGSGYSTGAEFLNKVDPTYAFISVGKDNSYGHPAQETIDLLTKNKVKVYRTDLLGSVVATSDGKTIKIDKSPVKINSPPIITTTVVPIVASKSYIANKSTKKFHLPSCKYLPYEKNRIDFIKREDAISAGYQPCKICKP